MMTLDYRVFRLPRALELLTVLRTFLGNMKSTCMVMDNIPELNDHWKEKQRPSYQFKESPHFGVHAGKLAPMVPTDNTETE